jgi:serine/threonine-protein kinase
MAELITDLKQSLINPDEDFVKLVDPDEEASTRMITDRDMVQIKRQSERRDSMEEAMRLKKARGRYYEEDDEDDEDWEDDEEDYDPKMEKITTILAVVAALLIGCIVLFLVGKSFGVFHFGEEPENNTVQEEVEKVKMIRVVGLNIEDAKRELLALGLTPEIQYEVNSAYPVGTVLRASVQDGIQIDKNSVVVMTVAQGTEGVKVPSVTGKSEAEATSILEKDGFEVNVTKSYDSTVEDGYVISQSPEADTSAPEGSAVSIRVSQGAEDNKVRVPDVYKLTEMDATVNLTESGLAVGTITEAASEEVEAGFVCYQSYSAGSYVDKGTPVDIRISTGPSSVTYRYSEGITAPTEDPDYRGGMEVDVTVTTADGTQLLSTRVTSFPVAVNYTGIKSASGVITFHFTVQREGATTTNPETGEIITADPVTEEKTVTREITFTQE